MNIQDIISYQLTRSLPDLIEELYKTNALVHWILKDRAIEQIKQQPFFGVIK